MSYYVLIIPENINYKGTNIGFVSVSDRHGQYYNVQPFLNAGYNKSGFANAEVYDIDLTIDSLFRDKPF